STSRIRFARRARPCLRTGPRATHRPGRRRPRRPSPHPRRRSRSLRASLRWHYPDQVRGSAPLRHPLSPGELPGKRSPQLSARLKNWGLTPIFQLRVELLHQAVLRRLVVAKADEPGAVADAAAAHVVERHLDDELRAKATPLAILLAGVPAVGLVHPGFARLVRLGRPHTHAAR